MRCRKRSLLRAQNAGDQIRCHFPGRRRARAGEPHRPTCLTKTSAAARHRKSINIRICKGLKVSKLLERFTRVGRCRILAFAPLLAPPAATYFPDLLIISTTKRQMTLALSSQIFSGLVSLPFPTIWQIAGTWVSQFPEVNSANGQNHNDMGCRGDSYRPVWRDISPPRQAFNRLAIISISAIRRRCLVHDGLPRQRDHEPRRSRAHGSSSSGIQFSTPRRSHPAQCNVNPITVGLDGAIEQGSNIDRRAQYLPDRPCELTRQLPTHWPRRRRSSAVRRSASFGNVNGISPDGLAHPGQPGLQHFVTDADTRPLGDAIRRLAARRNGR